MTQNNKYHISFDPIGKATDILPGANLMEAAWMAGISLASVCGGNRTCGQCRVVIRTGNISEPSPEEEKLLTPEDLANGYRLACCAFPLGDLKVHIPEKSLVAGVRLQLESLSGNLSIDPVVRTFDFHPEEASLNDPRADFTRVIEELAKTGGPENPRQDMLAVKQLPTLLRKNGWKGAACVRADEVIGFLLPDRRPVGFAVDLGTTKLASYLLDLETGEELASAGAVNPQTIHGEDVMSRLYHKIQNSDLDETSSSELAKLIRDKLNDLLIELVDKADVAISQVADMCIVGNTAMTHLLLDLPVRQLAGSPYVAATNSAIDVKARELGFESLPGAYTHVLPGIGGFVGADHVAMILATDIDRTKGVTLGVDIGTNTEIVISRNDGSNMISVACPSGPAFEGAHVSDGMRAARGAIESVVLTEDSVEYKTIEDSPAIGLCGSGIIDAVAELYKWDIIDERGRFRKTDKRVRKGSRGSEFVLASNQGNTAGNGVSIAQKDIDEIQLAKGAIKAGIDVLLKVTDTEPEAVTEVIIAGAFGSFINLINTIKIGMLPHFPNARYKQVGNAAGVGAKMALLSKAERERARIIAEGTEYVELTTYPEFNRLFAHGMMFPKKNQDIDKDKIMKEK